MTTVEGSRSKGPPCSAETAIQAAARQGRNCSAEWTHRLLYRTNLTNPLVDHALHSTFSMSAERPEISPRVLAVRRDEEGRTLKVILIPRPGSWAVVWERDGTPINVEEFATKRDAVRAAHFDGQRNQQG